MTALSSTCVAGIFTEDVGKPVHISALPTGVWTHIFTLRLYEVEVLSLPEGRVKVAYNFSLSPSEIEEEK